MSYAESHALYARKVSKTYRSTLCYTSLERYIYISYWHFGKPSLGNLNCFSLTFTYVTAAGLRASNSRNTSIWPELVRLGTRRIVTATRSVTVIEYYFYLWVGTCTSHTKRWRALSSRYSLLLGCWPFGFPIR